MQVEDRFMARCLELARHGAGRTAPNPMVGAVVVHNGEIVGEGYHRQCGEAHAEVNAIASVKDETLLRWSTLYVSLEPCAHHGKTPPCVDLIIRKRIPRVVVGCLDPFPEVSGRGVERLREAGIQPTAMMDISDGLSSELLHICTQSKVGCRIYEEHIPLDYQTAVMAEELNMNVTTCALNGGEDYELLFTVPIADHEKVAEMEGVKLIGHITKPELGCALITRDGQEFELKAQGWNHLGE